MKKTSWLYVFIACFLASCSSIQSFTFAEQIPAATSFPAQLANVAVVNNMVAIPAPKPSLLTLGSLEGDGKVASEMLAGGLADSRYFRQIIICDSALQGKEVHPFTGHRMLTSQEVDKLASELGVDMLFSLDRIAIHTERKQVVYPQLSVPFEALQVQLAPTLSVYVPGRDKPMRVLTVRDSVYWDIDPSVSDKAVIKEISERASSLLVPHLTPHWENTARIYFSGGSPEMRDAVVYLRENDWAGAQSLWESVYESRKKGNLKLKAAFNAALACEMQGDINQAFAWLVKAKALAKPATEEEQAIAFYASQLEKRKEELPKLELQMSRFQNKF